MNLQARLEERVSKDGKPYICVSIQLTKTLEKLVFLTPAELECINFAYGNADKNNTIKLNAKGE